MDGDTSFLQSGIVCTAAEYERSLRDSSIHCLTRNETIALMVPTTAALVSLVALSIVFAIVLFSLFSGGVLQALGAVVGFKWIHEGKVEVGGFCSAQGIMQQLGETVSALTILVIAVYAFLCGWLRKDIKSMPVWVTKGLVTAIWVFIAFMTMLGNVLNRGKGQPHFEAPTPYWCWIGVDYLRWRIWGQYFWWWLTLGVSFFICLPTYLCLRKAEFNTNPELKAIKRESLVTLAYPIVYCIFILPLSVVRWISFISHGGSHISTTTNLTVAAIFSLTPASNVALLLVTRTDSVLFGKSKNFTSGYPSLSDSQEYSRHNFEKNQRSETS
ncbi:hypothetical protein M413DRAFT_18552 [Hebeloma cylindrosporum]|uniref:Glucose receptor Git3 N-terminal domain-containing protein n=1 Tax=Hebeloma cylindrosporum TaxID=76867 RepID=A0A0C3CES2_HEBCY|nr:hypothetical protein M413DRAFT_18552 [Hebeloma cylindrosporum h7]